MNIIDSCACGGENKFSAAYAITTVPIQPWQQPYDAATGLCHGTIFPCLDLPFYVTGGAK